MLLGVRINVDDENERNEVIALVLNLMNRKLEITAGKLFRIDNTLLFSASLQSNFYC
jgi:gustatory receptor